MVERTAPLAAEFSTLRRIFSETSLSGSLRKGTALNHQRASNISITDGYLKNAQLLRTPLLPSAKNDISGLSPKRQCSATTKRKQRLDKAKSALKLRTVVTTHPEDFPAIIRNRTVT